eukprot:NODE_737_length_1214_cov_12.647210_g591_i0.p1 GENE.NODE_737_length_1214_cov_12.647210_g591_i0~~NODE_737_length_1214_cov_12.647210_g591_i0.p1  ORF type:complete len:297 (-),score=37.51 NODE_737_length_1214_cov_12.647210_g591_i0:276-1166(-)
MARVGEGDPRWIVADRHDGKNVNNWHWTERNITQQGIAATKAFFQGLQLVSLDGLTASISSVTDVSGEICLLNRKNRIKCHMELKLEAEWTGTGAVSSFRRAAAAPDGSSIKGTVSMPEIENTTATMDVAFTFSKLPKESSLQQVVRTTMNSAGSAAMRTAVLQMINELQGSSSSSIPDSPALPVSPNHVESPESCKTPNWSSLSTPARDLKTPSAAENPPDLELSPTGQPSLGPSSDSSLESTISPPPDKATLERDRAKLRDQERKAEKELLDQQSRQRLQRLQAGPTTAAAEAV